MPGVIVNTLAVITGSALGLTCRKGIPERVSRMLILAIGLCSVVLGIRGCIGNGDTLVLILSLVSGTALGSALRLQDRLNRAGEALETARSQEGASIAQGFITACLMFCVGAMTIMGALNAGLNHDNSVLYTKSLMDFVCSCMLSVSLGIGVLFSAAFVLVFEGGLVLLASALAPVLTEPMVFAITGTGSAIVIALGLNVLGFKELRVAELLPAILFAPFFHMALQLVSAG